MNIGIISDIHDQKENLEAVLSQLKQHEVEEILVLGDFCAPPTVKQLVESGLTCHCIFGNNDGDKSRILLTAQSSNGRVNFSSDDFDSIEIDRRKIFITHYPEIAHGIAASGLYDAVFYGHNHQAHQEIVGNCLLLNPGEVWGWLHGKVSFAIWDTQANSAEIMYVN